MRSSFGSCPCSVIRTLHSRLNRMLLFLLGVQAKLDEFGTHRNAIDAQPSRSLGLISMGRLNGTSKQFPLHCLDDAGIRLARLVTARVGQPMRRASAPVNAPRSWPKSSLSRSV